MSAPAIRAARAGDAQALSSLAVDTFVATFGHLYKKEDLSAFLKKSHSVGVYGAHLADPAYALWLAETETGEAVGYCVAGPCDLPAPNKPPRSGELARLYLREPAKGTGLGAHMLDLALDWLKAHYERIYLSVYAENFRAQRFYEKRGFVKIHDYFYMVGTHADPEWIMELKESA